MRIIKKINKKVLLRIMMGLVLVFLCGCGEKEDDLFLPEDNTVVVTEPYESRETTIIVEIKGQVLNPGVYSLKENQRLNDLIIESGGVTENANLRYVNLAMKMIDGDSFYIPSLDEEEETMAVESGQGAQKDGKIDLNRATKEELMTVSGIGPSTADNILAHREEHGLFKSVDDLIQVNRIGDKTLEKIREYFIVR